MCRPNRPTSRNLRWARQLFDWICAYAERWFYRFRSDRRHSQFWSHQSRTRANPIDGCTAALQRCRRSDTESSSFGARSSRWQKQLVPHTLQSHLNTCGYSCISAHHRRMKDFMAGMVTFAKLPRKTYTNPPLILIDFVTLRSPINVNESTLDRNDSPSAFNWFARKAIRRSWLFISTSLKYANYCNETCVE